MPTARLPRSRAFRARSPIREPPGRHNASVLDDAVPPVTRHSEASLVGSASCPTSDTSATSSTAADTIGPPATESQTGSERGQASVVIAQIEEIFEAVVLAVEQRTPLSIPLRRSRRSSSAPSTQVSFPGRTAHESRTFAAVIRILEIAHEALLTGNLVTKRNIFYQDKSLFRDQRTIDALVDDIACTLGVGRHALNIAAAGKGLVAGPISLTLDDDGSVLPCDDATLIPAPDKLRQVEWTRAQWILVIEKEATFRTLAASDFCKRSSAGPGILITGKGYPDLSTRKFLFNLHQSRPHIPIYGLVDYDPYGIRILRNYQRGSANLCHERDCTVRNIRWLGIKLADIYGCHFGRQDHVPESSSPQTSLSSQAQASQGQSSQMSDGTSSQRPKRVWSAAFMQSAFEANTTYLSIRDRKVALETIRSLSTDNDDDDSQYIAELQAMLMLNIKAEIQAVDNLGDIATWLKDKLCSE